MSDESGISESTRELSAERIARNDATFRDANEGIRATAEELGVTRTVPFVCECADPNCRQLLPLTLDEYGEIRADPRWFLNAPGHEVAAQGWGEVVAERDGYVVVEKLGEAGAIAEELEGKSNPASARLDGSGADR